MGNSKRRRFGYALVVVALAIVAGPAFGASGPGSIKITSPVAKSAESGVIAIDWVYRSGEYVRSSTKVNVYVTTNGVSWRRIAAGVPIRSGGIDWNSAGYNAPVAIRALVYRTPVRSTVSPVLVDNTAPTVDIVRPSAGQVIVDDATPDHAVVAGEATLVADARDSFTGIADVKWFLDDDLIGNGLSYKHNFSSATPGEHVLTAVAYDWAGNASTAATRNLITLPGPSGLGTTPSPELPDEGEIPTVPTDELPSPEESDLPTVPDVPSPDPSALPVPTLPDDETEPPPDPVTLVPSAVPTALPSP